MATATPPQPKPFKSLRELEKWLAKNHDKQDELWIRLYKKSSKIPSVTWNVLVVAGLIWGWIDGIRRSLDEDSFIQRMSPRRPKSLWSKKNRALAATLITEGRMMPSGLVHVESAKADGRWDNAYSGSAEMVIPDDFLKMLSKNKDAKKFYATLKRSDLYAIYHKLYSAKRPETRVKRIEVIITGLAGGKKPSLFGKTQ